MLSLQILAMCDTELISKLILSNDVCVSQTFFFLSKNFHLAAENRASPG